MLHTGVFMPNRVIRETLLDSERYWGVSQDARQFFFHLMLLADDLGVISLAPVMLRRRCFETPPTDKRLDKLIGELVDVDLIRRFPSASDPDVWFALIPRFRQRLQITKPKFELPPENLIQDDFWLQNKVKEFKDTRPKPTVVQHPVQHPVQRPESKRILETNRIEGKAVNSLLDKHPKKPATDQELEKSRRIAAACASGNLDLAKQIRDETA